jgi:hypothetical protein
MNGPPTGDFHSIYNAPMLGAHQPVDFTGDKRRKVTGNVPHQKNR